jgi:hypothetical protein
LKQKRVHVSKEGCAESMSENGSTNSGDEICWQNYEGQCQGCDIYSPVNDMSLCSDCADKLERDLIRQRDWNYSILAYAMPDREREELRDKVVKKYGTALELIAPLEKAGNKRSFCPRKKKNRRNKR